MRRFLLFCMLLLVAKARPADHLEQGQKPLPFKPSAPSHTHHNSTIRVPPRPPSSSSSERTKFFPRPPSPRLRTPYPFHRNIGRHSPQSPSTLAPPSAERAGNVTLREAGKRAEGADQPSSSDPRPVLSSPPPAVISAVPPAVEIREDSSVSPSSPSSRKFVGVDGSKQDDSTSTSGNGQHLRVLTYNVLGEYHGLRPLHDYCPRDLRIWSGDNGRAERIVQELFSYLPDIICLQEVTPRMFERDFVPALEGYEGMHVTMSQSLASMREKGQTVEHIAADMGVALDDIGLCTFVLKKSFQVVSFQSVALSEIMQPDKPSGKLRDKLLSLQNAVQLMLIRRIDSSRLILVANTQLFWHPGFPHVKALQAELVCRAITRFRDRHQLGERVPVVLCGDFNSVPEMQIQFLPTRQREYLLSSRSQGANGTLDAHNRSAVVQLLRSGKLATDHPEHPDTFGRGWEAKGKPFSEMSKEEKKQMRDLKKSSYRSPSWSYGQLHTGLLLQDTYEHMLGRPAPLTTCTREFSGAIDYIWHSPQVVPCAVLELPYDVSSMSNVPNRSEQTLFPPIPNQDFPSDHLALAADFELVP
uniref:Endonuclease/exonuclease/phosphatase domain-containing protein n=1 Tax=Guillardia theta TaxID=55529 RepID=A0A6U5YHS5_GUITH|mmetsp:Transcript_21787/g.72049  ORF Transcript_21787/g.72049 Transcript_21787/m.72049 type:complete len:585 (+) Transcript_21787:286-2040(+)